MTDKEIIAKLKALDKAAKKGPWYPQGAKVKDKTIYKLAKAEEDLIIAMRNHLADLIRMAEHREVAQ